MNLQHCVNDLLMRGTEDLIQASEVASVAIGIGGAVNQDEVREMSLEMIREVIRQRFMEIGDAIGVGSHPTHVYERLDFRPWGVPFEAAMERVAREWRALGRNPNLGEICWLCNTDQGNEIGKRLLAQGGEPPAIGSSPVRI